MVKVPSLIPTPRAATAQAWGELAAGSPLWGIVAKCLIHMKMHELPHLEAIDVKFWCDKQLANVCIVFPQSYPQLAWIRKSAFEIKYLRVKSHKL